jgi:hypothetical protein
MSTDAEIRIEGFRALSTALGDVEAERFITLILREPFDYTQWQAKLWPGQKVEDISKAAMRQRPVGVARVAEAGVKYGAPT